MSHEATLRVGVESSRSTNEPYQLGSLAGERGGGPRKLDQPTQSGRGLRSQWSGAFCHKQESRRFGVKRKNFAFRAVDEGQPSVFLLKETKAEQRI